ncbi:hypothetical protein BCT25_17460 [Vibrio sp. 10N.261.45.A6]|nr:hypothetical protein BCT25_17460 [Vibrio sp. 10N.261.45.A6]PMN88703.1 hypothetical protein BCT22_02475 [Vibrio sp. 10N.261.45.A1]
MKTILRQSIVSALAFAAAAVIAAEDGSKTLPTDTYLKDVNSDSVSYFKSEPLMTEQGHKATGEQTFKLLVNPESEFGLKAEGKEIAPGTSATLTKVVDENGVLSFDIAPAEAVTGKTDYEVRIANIYSNQDRFWSTHIPKHTTWTDTGTDVDHSTWIPELARQMANFTQNRSYFDVYERLRQDREIDSNVGEIRNVGDPVKETDNRIQTQTRTVEASVDTYANSGGLFDCATWKPEAASTYVGLDVKQARTCKQKQQRTWIYVTDGVLLGSHTQNQNLNVIDEQTVPGSRNPWESTDPLFGAWKNDGAGHTYSAWVPGIGSQTANFTQTQTYKQPERASKQLRELNAVTGLFRNVGASSTVTRTKSKSSTRNVTVSVGGYSNNGGVYSCSGWTPSTGSKNKGTRFTQSRNCKQKQTRTWNYKVGSTSIGSRKQDRVIDTRPTRTATGTKITNGTWVVFAEVQNTPPAVHSMVKQYLGNLSFNLYSGNDCKPYNGKTYCMSTVRRDPPSTCKVGDRYGYVTSQHPFAYGKVQECK